MTAAEAIASIREDIDRLEAKDLVKPGYIKRKRSEVAAIERELFEQEYRIAQAERTVAQQATEISNAELRIGMLANVLSILGHDPMPHIRRSLANNPDVYYDAAVYVDELRTKSGRSNRPWTFIKGYHEQRELLVNALWSARMNRLLTPTETLSAEQALNEIKEEDHQAAA
jgi:hypothetical protein